MKVGSLTEKDGLEKPQMGKGVKLRGCEALNQHLERRLKNNEYHEDGLAIGY
jgi:hypothetical protein